MTIKELHHDLVEAYNVSNLNTISLTLINLFKNQQYTVLQKISELISDFVNIDISKDGKGFSKLIMLYHPDRAGFHLQEINKLREQNNFDGLLQYAHILRLERIEEIASNINSYEDIDYKPVYEWDLDTEGFTIINVNENIEVVSAKTNTELIGYSFIDALKLREYGDMDTEMTSFLAEIDDFELSSSDLVDLDGIQFCVNARSIDLSDNRITDLSPLIGLQHLEELNLSYNEIGIIDELSFLQGLKSVTLSNNYIEDISPLFELENLEYVELSGNKINIDQINRLIQIGVTVDFQS